MPPKKTVRKIIGKIHLIMGLTTGLVVFIVAITGCLWVFQEEIQNFSSDFKIVKAENKSFITPTRAKEMAKTVFPKRQIHGVLYGNSEEAVEVIFYEGEPEFYQAVFLNPYDGQVIKTVNYESGFFAFVLDGHLNLWLPPQIGNQIVRWSVVVFTLMLITGIILWWPKNRKNRKQRFQFTWKSTTRWKRKNYDLHAILGFYVSLVALLFALTGIIMAFKWVERSVYQALGGEKSVEFTVPKNNSTDLYLFRSDIKPIDQLLPLLQEQFPKAEQFEIHYPHTSDYSIYVEITFRRGVYYSSDYRFYDANTLAELETPSLYGRNENAGLPEKVIRMNYDTHVGAILGLPGKILAFLASLLIASLPITGFMIWWGKRSKEKIKEKKADSVPFSNYRKRELHGKQHEGKIKIFSTKTKMKTRI